jgi:hypothetical protein
MAAHNFRCVLRLLLALLVTAHTQPAAAQIVAAGRHEVRATAADLFALAQDLLRRGASDRAEAILVALSGDPNVDIRNEARFRHAKLLQSKGMKTAAAVLLRQVIDERPNEAPPRLELAQLLQSMGDNEGAWRQVRAAQASGLPPSVARIVDRYSEALRALRPAGASFEIAVAPDSNINHATTSDTLGTVFGDFDIDRASKAQSGIGLSVRGQAFRRFAIGASDHSLLVRLSGYGDLYRTSSFNDIAADIAVGPELHLGRTQLNLELGATQRWFGQKPFIRSARAAFSLARPLGSRTQVRLEGSAAIVDNAFNPLQDGKAYSGQIALERALSPTTGLALNVSLDRQSLRDPGYSTTGWRAELTGWRDIGRATLTASAEAGRLKADERLSLFPQVRSESYSRLTIGATFRQLTFRGFAPVARFTIERNRSSIEFYDYRRTRSEFAMVRAF